MSTDAAPEALPLIQVVHGSPSAQELGIVVALLAAAGDGPAPEPEHPASSWSAPEARLGRMAPGRGGWRRSALPR